MAVAICLFLASLCVIHVVRPQLFRLIFSCAHCCPLCHAETREGALPEDRRQAWRRRLRLSRFAQARARAQAQRAETRERNKSSTLAPASDSLLSAPFPLSSTSPRANQLHPPACTDSGLPRSPIELPVAFGFVLLLLCVTSRLPFPAYTTAAPCITVFSRFPLFWLPFFHLFHCLSTVTLRYRYNGIKLGSDENPRGHLSVCVCVCLVRLHRPWHRLGACIC